MTVDQIVIVTASVVVVVGLLMRARWPGRFAITRPIAIHLAFLAVGTAFGGGSVYLLELVSSSTAEPPPGSADDQAWYGNRAWEAAGTYTGDRLAPLEPHTAFPDLVVDSWLNGTPDPGSVTVVEVWADW